MGRVGARAQEMHFYTTEIAKICIWVRHNYVDARPMLTEFGPDNAHHLVDDMPTSTSNNKFEGLRSIKRIGGQNRFFPETGSDCTEVPLDRTNTCIGRVIAEL